TVTPAHEVSDGGIAGTLAESCFGSKNLGVSVALAENEPAEQALFSEHGARCIVSVSPANLAAVLATARQYSVDARELGKVTANAALRIEVQEHVAIDSPLDVLRDIWANSLERTLVSDIR